MTPNPQGTHPGRGVRRAGSVRGGVGKLWTRADPGSLPTVTLNPEP